MVDEWTGMPRRRPTISNTTSTSQQHPNPRSISIASAMVDHSQDKPQILALRLLAPTRPTIRGRPVCHPSSSNTTLTFLYQYRVARFRPLFLCFLQPVTVDVASHRLVAASSRRRIVGSLRRRIGSSRLIVSSTVAASASPRHLDSNHRSPTDSFVGSLVDSRIVCAVSDDVAGATLVDTTIVASIGVVPVVDRPTVAWMVERNSTRCLKGDTGSRLGVVGPAGLRSRRVDAHLGRGAEQSRASRR
ncbi:uncharacterized protein J3D65DRAFT_635631 [Phyllosticta citribraziliensis]|uniref:Uncharacterized protein n=1 Tax=Phyllosticta citribraziliensis TaxID=989973 RepID=A0ABR1LBQ5_9PEZI